MWEFFFLLDGEGGRRTKGSQMQAGICCFMDLGDREVEAEISQQPAAAASLGRT